MGDSAEVVTDFVGGKEKKEEVNHSEGTGSFRKNGKSNLHSRGVYFHKISIFGTVPSSKCRQISTPCFRDLGWCQ